MLTSQDSLSQCPELGWYGPLRLRYCPSPKFIMLFLVITRQATIAVKNGRFGRDACPNLEAAVEAIVATANRHMVEVTYPPDPRLGTNVHSSMSGCIGARWPPQVREVVHLCRRGGSRRTVRHLRRVLCRHQLHGANSRHRPADHHSNGPSCATIPPLHTSTQRNASF